MSDDDLSPADPLGQIADEFVEALRQGQCPLVEEFARRYPEHADEIGDLLPALRLMDGAKSADDSAGQRRQADAAPLRQLGDCQTLREVGRGGRGRVSSDRQRKEQLRAPGRYTSARMALKARLDTTPYARGGR